jgi:hypothetical protein
VIIRLICCIVILFSFRLIVHQPARAQQILTKNIQPVQKEIWFDETIGVVNSGIFNGREYFIPMQGSKTHPFFGSRELTYEQITVEGQRYGNIPLMYDLFNDVLIMRHKDKNGIFVLIQLEIKNVDSFTLYGHTFRRISTKDERGNIQSSQLFDILVEGQTVNLVAKRKKETYLLDAKPEYREEDSFYFFINEQLIPIIRSKDIYSTFTINEDEIREFIKRNRLDHREENDLIRIAEYCDSITK